MTKLVEIEKLLSNAIKRSEANWETYNKEVITQFVIPSIKEIKDELEKIQNLDTRLKKIEERLQEYNDKLEINR